MDTLISYLDWNIVTAALVVIGLLLIALLAFRAIGGTVRGRRGARLAISEYHEIDKARRLVLVRRDGVEHLLMIGGAQDLVIETGIGLTDTDERDETYLHRPPVSEPSLASTKPGARRDDDDNEHAPVQLRPAPRPAVFGDKAPKLRPVAREEPRLTAAREVSSEENN